MALLTSEIDRIRFETGHNVLDVGAEPYIGVTALFDQVIAAYLRDGATTTSATAVTAATTHTPVAITLASATGFAAGARVIVDVDTRQEAATIQSLAGAVATVQLTKAHSGTYPVTVEGGESMVRAILARLNSVVSQIESAASGAGLKRAEDVEWYPDGGAMSGSGRMGTLNKLRDRWRDELCSLLGVRNMWRVRRGSGLSVALY